MHEKELISGYLVRVHGIGPFAFDHISLKYPELPKVVRVIQLATGENADWEYNPPDLPPDRSDTEEFDLYIRYHQRITQNNENAAKAGRARVEFFKLNSIEILHAPHPSWLLWIVGKLKKVYRLLGRCADEVPFQRRYLTFLDTEVIRSSGDWDWIQTSGLVPEVTVDGVLDAATRMFPGELGGESAYAGPAGGVATRGAEQVQHADVGDASGDA